jgi:hypothetical protein
MYYPEQRYAVSLMQFKRQVRLPEAAIGTIQVSEGEPVDIRTVVALGTIPAQHVIIDAKRALNVQTHEAVSELLITRQRGARVQAGEAIAGRDPERGRRVLAPSDGIVVAVDDGRIIFQETPQIIKLEAGVRGKVSRVGERGVEISGTTGILQGVWGNGQNVIAILRPEPEAGIATIQRDTLDTTYRGEVIVTRKPLTYDVLTIAAARDFAGIIAPSMSADLIDAVRSAPFAVMLTVGFGQQTMTNRVLRLLEKFVDKQVALDAAEPRRFDPRRPEAIFSQTVSAEMPVTPDFIGLDVGTQVRVASNPYLGRVGEVTALPPMPIDLPNGLRVPCARVRLTTGQNVDIPLVNLELAGT